MFQVSLEHCRSVAGVLGGSGAIVIAAFAAAPLGCSINELCIMRKERQRRMLVLQSAMMCVVMNV